MQLLKRLTAFIIKISFNMMSPFVAGLYLHKTTRARVRLYYIDQRGDELELMVKGIFSARQNWVYPGGGVDKGETSRQAAARELQEETGITIDSDQLVFLGREIVTKFRVFYYTVELFELKIDDKVAIEAPWPEIIAAKFMTIKAAETGNSTIDKL